MLSGSDYYKGFHSFVLLGELAKSEFGKSVHSKGQRVHFDQSTTSRVLKDKENIELFQVLDFLA